MEMEVDKDVSEADEKRSFQRFHNLIQSNSLSAGITYFLNRVTKHGEGTLIWEYITRYPSCEHFVKPFEWDKDEKTYDLLLVVLKALTSILLYLYASSPDMAKARMLRSVGERLVASTLASHMKSIYHCLRTVVPSKLIGACLRFLTAMVMQGVEPARKLMVEFNFSYKPLGIFVNKNSPIPGEAESLRNLMMNFALSFLELNDSKVVAALLEFKGFLSSFFSLLPKDDPSAICRFLSAIHEKVLRNSSISKKAKSLFFNQFVLKQIAVLLGYPRGCGLPATGDHAEPELHARVQEVAFGMLVVLGSDVKLGILYHHKPLPHGLEKTNNPVLLHLMLFLSNCLQEEANLKLLLLISQEGVDMLQTFVRSLTFSLEPQPTSKWLREMAFLTQVYSSHPSLDTLLDNSSVQPDVNWVGVAISATTPPTFTRTYYNQGLQHPLPVVKYSTLKLINVVLERTGPVLSRWGPIRKNSTTIVSSFLVRYADMVLKSLPDIKTLVSLWHSLQGKVLSKGRVGANTLDDLLPEDKLRNSDLENGVSLRTQVCRALSGYQRLCPNIFLQINFNPAKLLPSPRATRGGEGCLPRKQELEAVMELVENYGVDSRSLSKELSASLLGLLLAVSGGSSDELSDDSSDGSSGGSSWLDVVSRILFKGFVVTNGEGELVLTTFVSSCLSRPEEAGDLVESMAVTVSELQWNKNCLERETLKAMKGSCEEGSEERELLLLEVIALPEYEAFDILEGDDIFRREEPITMEFCDEDSMKNKENLFLYTFVTSTAIVCERHRNSILCAFLSSLLLRCCREWTSHNSPSSLFHLVLTCAPSLTLFLVHRLLMAGKDAAALDRRTKKAAIGAVNLKEITSEAMHSSCVILKKMTSENGRHLNMMRHLEVKHWNELVYSCLKHYFTDGRALLFLSYLLPLVYGGGNFADAASNKVEEEPVRPLAMVYEMIWSHSDFLKVMTSDANEHLVRLLVSVVELDPAVCTGNVSHYAVFLGAYSATMSKLDRGLLYLMYLYEQGSVSAGQFHPFYWGPAALERHQFLQQGNATWRSTDSSSDVLRQLNSLTLLKSASHFCPTYSLQPTNPFLESNEEVRNLSAGDASGLYDLAFLLPLLSHSLGKEATVDCRSFVSAGCLGYLVVCLSSLSYSVREAASHTLSRFKSHLEASRFREKAQISLLLEVLQNTVKDLNAFVPSVFTSLVAKTSRLFLQAESPVYSVVAHFMVYKPALNLLEIPLMNTMMHSSSSNATHERAWLMKVLVDGLRSDKDLVLYRKHKVLSHVAVLADSGLLDRKAKTLATELLEKATSLRYRQIHRLKVPPISTKV